MDTLVNAVKFLRWLLDNSIDETFSERFIFGYLSESKSPVAKVAFPNRNRSGDQLISLAVLKSMRAMGWLRFGDPTVSEPVTIRVTITAAGVRACDLS